MERDTLFLILTGVVCGCCVLLFAVVTYLCVAVKRIRRKLDDLSRRGSIFREKSPKGANITNGENSGVRYVLRDPLVKVRPRQQSSHYSDPDEQVYVLEIERGKGQESAVVQSTPDLGSGTSASNIVERPREPEPHALGSSTSTQNIVEQQREPEDIPLQFVNPGFSPEATKDPQRDSLSESQPIYANEEVCKEDDQAIYENNDVTDDPIYQNTGELADINNPDLYRCATMDISQIP